MTRVPTTSVLPRVLSRALRRLRGQAGITMLEMLIATALFAAIAAPLATVLTSSINSHRDSRQKTIAQQIAMEEIEEIRQMAYEDVGTLGGNPPGVLDPSYTVSVTGLNGTVTTQVAYVDDPAPTSYANAANYKQVTVSVFRASDSKLLTREVTYVAPPERAPFGGINNAIINVQVIDYGNNTPVEGATVDLTGGPPGFSARSDTTDVEGLVTFAALTPNGVSDYYDIAASESGYVTLSDDVPPGSAAHVQLAPSQTLNTAIRIYRPATIDVALENFDTTPYTGTGTVTVSSSRGSETFAYDGEALTITTINGEQVVPGLQYTVSAQTTGGITADPVTQYVPDDYPTDLTSSFTLVFPEVGAVTVLVTWGGSPVSGATVTLTGGPESVSLSGTTSGSGQVTFGNVPAGTGYAVTATKSGESASASDVTVTVGQTTTVDLALPTGSVAATVTWSGGSVEGATVTLAGGPMSVNVSGTTDSSGQVVFANVPAGTGYTVTATKSGQSSGPSGATVTGGDTTSVSLALPTATLTVTVTWPTAAVSDAVVTLSGGPLSLSPVDAGTNESGVATFTNVPAGSGYTVTATKSGQSTTLTSQTVSAPSTNIPIALPTGSVTVTVTWAGQAAGSASVTLSGGPMSINATGTANSSGQFTFTNVPVGSGYTASGSKNGGSGSTTPITTTTGTTAVSVAFTQTKNLVVTVMRSGSPVSSASVSITGGPNGTAGANPAYTGTTNASGQVTIVVPAASGYTYTVRAYKCSVSSPKRGSATVTAASGTTTVTVTFSFSSCPGPLP